MKTLLFLKPDDKLIGTEGVLEDSCWLKVLATSKSVWGARDYLKRHFE